MALSSSQQLVLLFTAALCFFIIFPRFFTGGSARDSKAREPHFRTGPHPGPGSALRPNPPQRGPTDDVQQVQRLAEQEVRKEKAKINSNNKGFVFTIMPLYAIGVGLFAAYKFLKIKSADDSSTHKEKTARGLHKSEETENQLNELEQRLAQTEKMLNSILTQLDPLTNCVKTVAMDQKNEIMTQLQCIRHLMKKQGMQYTSTEASCERNLDNLIESLSAMETLNTKPQPGEKGNGEEIDSMPPLEEENEDRVGEEPDDEEIEKHYGVGRATEEYDEDLYIVDQEENIEEAVAEICHNEFGAGLRRRNVHD